MKATGRARVVLILLSTVAVIAAAQSSTELSLPDVAALVQQAILQQRFAESREQDYVFREETNDIRLRKECTWAAQCPDIPTRDHPVGVAFRVVRYAERNFEIFWLDGVRVARVLPSCDHCGRGTGPSEAFIMNIPVSDSELAAENPRVDSEVAEARTLRAQGKVASSPDDPPQIFLSRMLELCTFSNPRRQVVEGRSTVLLDFAWNPSVNPVSANETLLKFFSGTVGIDEEDHTVQHVEGKFLADVKLNGGIINIRKGTRVTIINRRVDTGIWLLSRLDARGEARYFAFAIDGDGHLFTGNYRKFRATSRILPGYTEVPANSPAPPNRAPAPEYRAPSQEVQVREYWVDPSTGRMWAGRDNGKNVSWHNAMKYCRDLRLAGYSDWRLATLDELASLVDKSAPVPGRVGNTETFSIQIGNAGPHVRGNLTLTGDPWSSNREMNRFGHPYGDGWFFDFVSSKPSYDLQLFRNTKYALCVRHSGE